MNGGVLWGRPRPGRGRSAIDGWMESHTLLKIVNKFLLPIFYIFIAIWINLDKRDVLKILFINCDFHENRLCLKLGGAAHEFLSVFSTFAVHFSEIRCKKSGLNTLEYCEFREILRWEGRTFLTGVSEITVVLVSSKFMTCPKNTFVSQCSMSRNALFSVL